MAKNLIFMLLIVGTGAIAFLYLMPEWETYKTIGTDIEQLTLVSAELDVLIQARESLASSLARIPAEDVARIEKLVPRGGQEPEYMAFIEYLAHAHGMVLKGMTFSTPAQTQAPGASGQPVPEGSAAAPEAPISVKELPVGFTLLGSYESFKALLADLEKSARFTDIQDITFNGSDDPRELLTFTVRAKIYFQ